MTMVSLRYISYRLAGCIFQRRSASRTWKICSSDGDTEVEEQEDRLKGNGKPPGGTKHVFLQRELVARAFAGDNVIQVRG